MNDCFRRATVQLDLFEAEGQSSVVGELRFVRAPEPQTIQSDALRNR